jgi:hypothetical protein
MTDADLIDDIAEDVESNFSIELRDPYQRPYGEPERTTESQKKLWNWLRNYDVWRQAMIGGKGSGKSHYGATFSYYFGQEFPGCEGACIANTDRQSKDAAGEHFMNVGSMLNFNVEYFKSKKMHGQEQSKFYVVDLDGKGYQEGLYFMIKVRSLEAVDAMEGSEFDFIWFEELQDGDRPAFVKAQSRNRGTAIADEDTMNPVFLAGMTDGAEHWMYEMLEDNMSFPTEDQFDPEEDDSVLLEPTLMENKQNIGQAKIDEYYNTFNPTEAERLIHAERVSQNKDRALYEYRSNLHTNGLMSKVLCDYDPYREIIVSVDFNISPMCASVWQVKEWNHDWQDENLQVIWNDSGTSISEVRRWTSEEDYETYPNLRAIAEPDTEVLAQIDEYEIWPNDQMGGGTEGFMRNLVSDYKSHTMRVTIVGDAQGNSRTSASSRTDWDIIREWAQRLQKAEVVPGLESNDNVLGPVKYSNPPVKDTLNITNRLLSNANGEPRMCFQPQSDYDSGGVKASVSACETDAKGRIDDKRDRSEDRKKPRTHFLDTVRYVAWFFEDGAKMTAEQFDQHVDELDEMERGGPPHADEPNRYAGFNDEEEDDMGYGESTDLLF